MCEERKPCPFCGGHRIYFERWVDLDQGVVRYRLYCGACFCAADVWKETASEALAVWNTRPIEDALWVDLKQKESKMVMYLSYYVLIGVGVMVLVFLSGVWTGRNPSNLLLGFAWLAWPLVILMAVFHLAYIGLDQLVDFLTGRGDYL